MSLKETEMVDHFIELRGRPTPIHRSKPIVRHVPLTNGILYAEQRRSVGDRGYSDRFTSTSTSSQGDTEAEWGNGARCTCNDCRLTNNRRKINRFSMPRLGQCSCDSDGDGDVGGGCSVAVVLPPTESRAAIFRRRRRNRTAGLVLIRFDHSFIDEGDAFSLYKTATRIENQFSALDFREIAGDAMALCAMKRDIGVRTNFCLIFF